MAAATDDDDLPMTDAGPRKGKPGEARHCIVYRAVRPLDELVRFVVGPGDVVVPDLKRKLPGRGASVTATRKAVEKAASAGLFARAFRRAVTVPADLADQVDALIEKAALDQLSLANKAGAVIQGFTRVEEAIDRKPVVALIHAREAAADGVGKLFQALRVREIQRADVRILRDFSGAQLDLALGRSNVVHACLLAGPASEGFLARATSLAVYRN
jgi:hypothetical protein